MIQLLEHFTYKKLIRFTIPTVAMMIFTSVYGVVDGLFVSNVAKENIVGTMGILYPGGWSEIGAAFTAISGFSFLVFNLLCAPCFAAIGAIKREMNNAKWTCFAVAYQCVFAYAIALMINQFGGLFTGNVNVIGLIFAVLVLAFMIYMLVRPYKEANTLKTAVKVK